LELAVLLGHLVNPQELLLTEVMELIQLLALLHLLVAVAVVLVKTQITAM
jgi:hypothetical protein